MRDLEFWAQEHIQSLIEKILSFLSNDRYTFKFVSLKRDRPEQTYFEFGDRKEWPFHAPKRVLMFSGGLDSLAGAIETAANGGKVVLVSHRPVSTLDARQNQLFKQLQQLYPSQLIRVPVWINKDEKFGREPTQRTRSFLFAALGTLVAQSIEADGVRFFENGVVSLNLPLAQEALRSRASRTTHPLALHLLSSLCAAVVEKDLAVDNPYLFKTKTEVEATIAEHKAAELIGSTCSCSHSMFQTKTQRHCGRCSQCIDRRVATLAAELQSSDSPHDYVSDVFLGPREDPLEKAIAIDYVRHGLGLNRKHENELAATFNIELSRAVRHVENRSQVAREIISMHKRHGEVVRRVLEEQLRSNAAEVVGGTLHPTSLLAMVATREHLSHHDRALAHRGQEARRIGENVPSPPGHDSAAALLRMEALLQNLDRKIDGKSTSALANKKREKPRRRDSIIFAALVYDLKGVKYCCFLKDHGVKPKWSEPCPSDYHAGYREGQPWRKKIQDEKTRAKTRMQGFPDSILAEVFNVYLPHQFMNLSRLLSSRNSRPASKTLASPKPRKH